MKDNFKNIVIGFLIGVVCLLVVLIYLVANGTISFSSNNDSSNNDEVIETIKVYESEDFVYDAEYLYNNKYTEYGEGAGKSVVDRGIRFEYSVGKQYLKDLKVPYINIKSSDADNVNNTLKDLYIEMAENFDLNAENFNNTIIAKQVLTYRAYQYNNILSVVVIAGGQATSNWDPKYYTYNFDLTNGELLSFSEGISKLGYKDKEDLLNRVKSEIKDKMDELFGGFGDLTNSCRTNKGELTNCYDMAYDNFMFFVNNDNVEYFVDNEGNLSVFFFPDYSNSEAGGWTYLVVVEK